MDEIPIATSNPINLIIKKAPAPTPPPATKSKDHRLKKSFFNLVYMTPFALLMVAQFFFLGKSIARFTTFPHQSISTYVYLAVIAILFFVVQILIRSMIYSTIAGTALVVGIYSSWFGSFLPPIIENLLSTPMIIEAAWAKKDIPFDLMMTAIMSVVLFSVTLIQFLASLFVKGFFETIFGKEWGDGKIVGYISAVAILILIHFGFYYYASHYMLADKLDWQLYQKYKPIESFLTRTAGSTILLKDTIYQSSKDKIISIDSGTGKITNQVDFESAVLHKGFVHLSRPVFFSKSSIIAYSDDLKSILWETNYPTEFSGVETTLDESPNFNIPLTSYPLQNGKLLLVIYDYGFAALYDLIDGKENWLVSVDSPIKTNRIFSDEYLEEAHFLELGDSIVFSGWNGVIQAIDIDSGKMKWEYRHDAPVHVGRGQKALLSKMDEHLVATFKSGDIVTIKLENGRRIFRASNPNFSTAVPPICSERMAEFITDDGIIYKIDLDGGQSIVSENVLPHKSNLMPVIYNPQNKIIAHWDEIIKVDENYQPNLLLKTSKIVFATDPVFDDKIMYIGTIEGWVICIHIGSGHEKWRIKIGGELSKDSLHINRNRLLIKSKSGSLFSIKRSPGDQFDH